MVSKPLVTTLVSTVWGLLETWLAARLARFALVARSISNLRNATP